MKEKKVKKTKRKISFHPIKFIKRLFGRFFTLLKKIVKDLKRVRWPNKSEMINTYWKVILFIVIGGLVLFGLAIGFQAIWDSLGVGINE